MMRKSLVLLIGVIFLASCSSLADKYRDLPEVKEWEDEIRSFEELDSKETYPRDAILFMGSSSIRLWKTLPEDMAPYNVIHRGFGGSELEDFVVYTDRIVSPHECSAIVIFIANDITGGKNDKTPEEVASMFTYVLKTIRKTHRETPVFWIAVTPSPSRWKAWPKISEAAGNIKRICEKNRNTYFIRTDTAFIGSDGEPVRDYFVSDMLHLNPEGYKVWTRIIKPELKKIVPMPHVSIIAHRGASYDAPENTIAASKLAWKQGADAVECDIHLTRDNKIIVSHDAGTKRTTGKELVIKETSLSDLRSLDAGTWKGQQFSSEKMPLLEELVSEVPAGKELVIEIKSSREILPELKRLIDASRKDITYTFIAFDFLTITETKKLFPKNRCYWLCSNKELLTKNMPIVPETGIDGLSLSYGVIDDATAAKVREMNKELFTWTVDDPVEAKRLLLLGVKGITTNRPGWLRQQLGM